MTKSKNTKRALLASVLSMMLCMAMLIGSTFAWFTDSVTSGTNRIVAGNLDVELYYKNASTDDWADASKESVAEPSFFVDADGEAILWEPGVMAVTQFKVANVGSLALKYSLDTLKTGCNNLNGHDLSEVIKFAVIDNESYTAATTREDIIDLNPVFDDFTGFTADGHLLPADKATDDEPAEKIFTVVAYWAPGADDNLYNVNNGQETNDGADQLYINIDIRLSATQYEYEKDSFDENYDKTAEYKKIPVAAVSDLPAKEMSIDSQANNSENYYGEFSFISTGNLVLDAGYVFTHTENADASPYRTWNADFVVSFDQDIIKENSVVLAGNYGNYNWCAYSNYNYATAMEVDDWWPDLGTIKAGQEIRLLDSFWLSSYPPYAPIKMPYWMLPDEFKCGAAILDEDLIGMNITVELRLYETIMTTPGVYAETGNYVVVKSATHQFENVSDSELKTMFDQ